MPKANRSACDPGDFWIESSLPTKVGVGGYYHGWDINNTQYRFRITEKSCAYMEIAKEVQEAVQAVFRKYYGDQDGKQ